HVVISVTDDEEKLILEEEIRSKMLDKQNDPISIEKKIKISPIDYSKLNKTKEDFGKCFVNKKELSAEQAFWLKHSSFFETPVTSHTPVKIKAHSELPKVTLVNEGLKKIKYQLANFDNVVKKRLTSDAITAGSWGFEHTKECFVTEIIPFLKVLKDTFNAFDKTLLDEITEVQTVFNQMEAARDQSQSQENDTIIRKLKDMIKSLSGKDSLENIKKDIDEIETINIELEHNLNAQLQEKVFANAALKNELRKPKGNNVVDTAVSKPNATIALGMFKLDIEPISPRLKNNRDAHETCPNSPKPSEKLVAVTPMNKDKRVRFIELVTSSSNIPKQTNSLKTKDSNKPLFTSTGVKPTTGASGSKPSSNTKNNRITRPPSSNQKNKVKDHSRKIKSSLNNTNSISAPVSNALVKHSIRNAKFESICAICNKCLFDANHEMCIIDYVNDLNMHLKSKPKRNKMRKGWKPTDQ
ncbi:hypothetical protein Tco_1435347, partial [Tanacetum coccineum]